MITIVITLILIGILLFLEEKYIPMDAAIKQVIRVVVLIAVVLWLLQVFGIWSGHMPHIS
jgi:hypothetical protein